MNIRSHSLVLAVLCAATVPARAQFPGDVLFTEPQVVVEEGATAELEVVVFTGAQPFGAATLAFDFDPAALAVESVRTGNASELAERFAYGARSDEPTTLRFGTVNNRSLARPFGTVSLARIRVRPLVGAGKSTEVALRVLALHETSGVAFAQPRGFGARISVVQKQALGGGAVGRGSGPSGGEVLREVPPELRALARRLVPDGMSVRLLAGGAVRGAGLRWVVVPAQVKVGDRRR